MKVLSLKTIHRITKARVFSNFINLGLIQLSNMLLLVIMYPIITRIVGIEDFGNVMLASTFAGLAGIIINFGTNQSGVKHIALFRNNLKAMSGVFYNTLGIRIIFFLIFLLLFSMLSIIEIRYHTFLLFAMPLVLAEVLNPLFFFLGIEKLSMYNIANVVSKLIIIALIIIFINGPADAHWVNFIIGAITTLTYAMLCMAAVKKFNIHFQMPNKQALLTLAKENFYLTGNNLSVYLQQSLMIFALAKWGNPQWLGAYSLCDKVIWSVKLLIMSVSNAIYPKAAQLYQEGIKIWTNYMQSMKIRITLLFFGSSILIYALADPIVHVLAGKPDNVAVIFLRVMAFLPTFAALNSLNVLNLLIKNDNRSIFRIAILLLILAFMAAGSLVFSKQYQFFGAYTLIIELSALLMYEYAIKKHHSTKFSPSAI